MKHFLMATAAVGAISLGAPAMAANCETSMNSAYDSHGEFLMEDGRVSLANRQIVRNLRQAAVQLRQEGHEEACEQVVQAMQTAAESLRENAKDRKTEGMRSEKPEDVKARVVAFGSDDKLIDSEKLDGVNVYNYENEFLGEVDGMIMRGGKPTHLIVGHGGFWNIGDDEAAIPVQQIKWDPAQEVMYLNMTEEQLDKAPDYDKVDGKWTPDGNDAYFDKLWK